MNFSGTCGPHAHVTVCHDDHVSQGQGRDDDDGGDRGEENTEEGRGQGARAGDTPRLVSTFGILNTLVYLFE